MPQSVIREILISDYARMIDLWKQSDGIGLSEADTEENIERFLKRNPGLSFVCVSGDNLLGTVLCGHDGRRGYIYHLAVETGSKRKHIGGDLMARALAQLRQMGILRCHLFLYDTNEDAKAFYERTGWMRRKNLLIYSKDI